MIYSFYRDLTIVLYFQLLLKLINLQLLSIAFESIIIHYERVKNILPPTSVSYSFRRKNRKTKGKRIIINMHSLRVNPHPESLLLDLVRIFLVTVAFPEIRINSEERSKFARKLISRFIRFGHGSRSRGARISSKWSD